MTHIKRQILIASFQVCGLICISYYIHSPKLMKLIFAVSYMSRMTGLTRSYET